MSNRKYITVITLGVLISFTLIVLFLISPKEKIYMAEPKIYKSIGEFKTAKLQQAVTTIKKNKTMDFTITVSEEELNEILYLYYTENKAKLEILNDVTGIQAVVTENEIKFFLNRKIFNILNIGYSGEFIPKLQEGTVILKVNKVNIGLITVPKELVLKNLSRKSMKFVSVDKKNLSVILTSNLPKQLNLKNLYTKDKTIYLDINISINSIEDIFDLMNLLT